MENESVLPRSDRLDWDHYFMALAVLIGARSPDPNTAVGSVICGPNNKIISTGYNGLPVGVDCKAINWSRDNKDPLSTKYPFIIHSEANAILSTNEDLTGSTLYVNLHPCNQCAQLIIQKNIKKVYYLKNPYKDTWQVKAAQMLFKWANIEVTQFVPKVPKIEIDFGV
ncbi:MAG: dCMP deaminase family protein [Patescibacteria group bacterium]